MISLSRLLGAAPASGDGLRYGDAAGPHAIATPKSAAERKPIVVWNITRTCNLACVHCYSDSHARSYAGELTGEEGLALIDDLADFGAPSLLLSGGEPMVHPLFRTFVAHARRRGLRVTISTNGTLLTPSRAAFLKDVAVSYVGVSFDGIGAVNDRFRGKKGAFDAAVAGLRAARAAGLRVGLRMTLTRHNAEDLPNVFRFVEDEGIDRVCFYHLVYSGRGRFLAGDALAPAEIRAAVDAIVDFAGRTLGRVEVLTVAQPADGVYLYLRLARAGDPRAEEVLRRIRWNGGGRWGSGVGIACVGPTGDVHPDQFWRDAVLGNVRKRPFSEIWSDASNEILAGLRDRLPRLRGRCGLCRFRDACGGGFRARAAFFGDAWGEDPACYLSEEEILEAAV